MASKSEDPDDDLYILRERATCPICKEFYNRPRKLSCCHVVCLDCIKRHVSLWHESNFPPCPLCRKPIMHSEVNKLEPALAEQDIVTIVRKYETCDICKRKENPSVKCLECKYSICKSCRPCHEEYNRSHTVVTILTSQKECNLASASRCDKHPDQYLTLYCIMCNNVLCLYCEKHLHKACANKYRNSSLVCERFDRGLLREYASSSNAVKPLGGSDEMPSCLYIQDFSVWSLKSLEKLKKEMEQCTNFFHKCSIQCKGILTNRHEDNNALFQRRDSIFNEFGRFEQIGNELLLKIKQQLDAAVAVDIAKSVLEIERQCINFFRIRSKYFHELIPTEICMQNNTGGINVLTSVGNATMITISGIHKLSGIFKVSTVTREDKIFMDRHPPVDTDQTSSHKTTSTYMNTGTFVSDKLVAVFHADSGETMEYITPPFFEPRCEKTGLRGFRPGPTQTGLYSHRRWLEA